MSSDRTLLNAARIQLEDISDARHAPLFHGWWDTWAAHARVDEADLAKVAREAGFAVRAEAVC